MFGSSEVSLSSIMSWRELIQDLLKRAGRSTFLPGSNGLSTSLTSRITWLCILRMRSSIADVSAWLFRHSSHPALRPAMVPPTSASNVLSRRAIHA